MDSLQNQLHKLPSVDRLSRVLELKFPDINPFYLTRFIRDYLEEVRKNPAYYDLQNSERITIEQKLTEDLEISFRKLCKGSIQPVINATGVVLHTGLGRAPLDERMGRQLKRVRGYVNLEFDLESGKRGQRNDHLAPLLRLLTGAEDGFAVNNNAAAVLLMLNTLGNRKEVILSRGEMIEIGGSFRLPEVMKVSGSKLKEIGTTNKTHLRDYRQAISAKTGAILICHTSNYEVQGFTVKPALRDIVSLAHEHGLPVIYDLGSGSFSDSSTLQNKHEPEITEIVEQEVDLISFSGDKLLGGPQAGVIIGKKKWVQKCAKNHLLRALRLDKFILKALQETLLRYLYKQPMIFAHQALKADPSVLKKRCTQLRQELPESQRQHLKVVPGDGKVGSGAFPLLTLPGYVLKINYSGKKANRLSRELRLWEPSIISYISENHVYLDLRTVSSSEEEEIKKALVTLLD